MIGCKTEQDRTKSHVGRWNSDVVKWMERGRIDADVVKMPFEFALRLDCIAVKLGMKTRMLIVLWRSLVIVVNAPTKARGFFDRLKVAHMD